LGLIGRGAWSRNIAATLDAVEGIAWEPINPAVPSARERLDGVIIANKSRDHAATAIGFLEAGIACFIEKPVAASLADFERIRQASLTSGASVFAGHIHLFNPACETFLAQIPLIGRIKHVSGEFANNRPRDDVSVIWDWLPHPLSIAGRIFDAAPAKVTAVSLADEDRPLSVRAHVSYGEADFEITANWLSEIPRMEIHVHGENGSISFDDKADRKVRMEISGKTRYPAYAPEPPLLRELQAFVGLVRGERPNSSTLDEAESVVRCLDAIERSIAENGQTQMLSARR